MVHPVTGECVSCKDGFVCDRDNPKSLISLGYWRLNSFSTKAIKCPLSKACCGDNDELQQDKRALDLRVTLRPSQLCQQLKSTNQFSYNCKDGYQGALCGECEPGYGMAGDECTVCDQMSLFTLLFAVVIVLYFVLVYTFLYLKSGDYQSIALPAAKIMILLCQQFSILSHLRVYWTRTITFSFDLFRVLSASFSFRVTFAECVLQMDIFGMFILAMCVPLLLIVFLIVPSIAAYFRSRAEMRAKASAIKEQNRAGTVDAGELFALLPEEESVPYSLDYDAQAQLDPDAAALIQLKVALCRAIAIVGFLTYPMLLQARPWKSHTAQLF
jgi:hypothetical protein